MLQEEMLLQSDVEMVSAAFPMEENGENDCIGGDIDDPEAFRPADEESAAKDAQNELPQRQQKPCDICELVPVLSSSVATVFVTSVMLKLGQSLTLFGCMTDSLSDPTIVKHAIAASPLSTTTVS